MTKLVSYIIALNLCLALVSAGGSAWLARSIGSQAYWAGGLAALVVAVAGSLALVISYVQSRQVRKESAVTSVLLAMLVRMGLPIAAAVLMQATKSPLLEAGFMGLLTLNYLVALPLETLMSLRILRESNSAPAG